MELNAPLGCEMLEVLTPTPISQIEVAIATVTHPPKKGYRTIRLPLAESEYDHFLSHRAYAKTRLDELYPTLSTPSEIIGLMGTAKITLCNKFNDL